MKLASRYPRRRRFRTLTVALAVVFSVTPFPASGKVSAIAWSDENMTARAPLFVASIHMSYRPRPANQFCTGALIAPSWVLTAAHCYDESKGVPTSVRVGETVVRRVTAVHVPSAYTNRPVADAYLSGADIALLRLARPVTGITPVGMPDLLSPSTAGTARVYGYGLDEQGLDPQRLGARGVELESGEWAGTLYPFLPARQISAFGSRLLETEGSDGTLTTTELLDGAVCEGDSGGALVVDGANGPVAIGVVSYGLDCAEAAPSIYTKVFAHLKWVRKTLRTTSGR